MKKISLVALACTAAVSVMAQDGSTGTDANKDYKPMRTPMASKVRFGITAGINSSKFYYSGSGTSGLNTTMKVGPFGGAYVNLPLGSGTAGELPHRRQIQGPDPGFEQQRPRQQGRL
ncbi:MAG: hypothetical protein EOO12_10905 [Chitinophagaceae bacterium]|nr:MAG: hypothetical protein EOO12_10905 [Chitinophagaceae bacterium]